MQRNSNSSDRESDLFDSKFVHRFIDVLYDHVTLFLRNIGRSNFNLHQINTNFDELALQEVTICFLFKHMLTVRLVTGAGAASAIVA